MTYLFFIGGSGNRGCEAIVRGTKEILSKRDLILYSSKIYEDVESGLNKEVECRKLREEKTGLKKYFSHLLCSVSYHFGNGNLQAKQIFSSFFNTIKKNDTYLVIGGDVYCYDKPRIYYRTNEILKQNTKVLWGCSIEPSNIDKEMEKDLNGYDAIYARESITYNALISHGIHNNVYLFPDPAFAMKAEPCSLPREFDEENTIGINVSPLITSKETIDGITISNYKNLIKHILDTTECKIALIPHVIWENNDDRTILKDLYESFKETNRIFMVDALPARKIKYIISKCKFMVAARTHASIAAYSSCVPTLVVGYSVKARGIAKDLFGTEEHYVIPVQNMKNEDDLTNEFCILWKDRENIKSHLEKIMPDYCKPLENIEEILEKYEKEVKK